MALPDRSGIAVVSGLPEDVHSLILRSFLGEQETLVLDHPVHAAFGHHFQAPGGGARVLLTHRCATLLGIDEADGRCLAAAVECLHNASLVQDDLQDHSLFRRGQASVMAKFGEDVALGLTDRLITTAFACVAEINDTSALPELIRRMNEAVGETVEGQTTELDGGLDGCSLDARLMAARKKSGPLFALALELPFIAARQQSSLPVAHEAACLFGLGYQILDDLKDQHLDAESPSNANLVDAMENDLPDRSAEAQAVQLARQLLHDASRQAESLPWGAGIPLIELIERLLLQIDSFSP